MNWYLKVLKNYAVFSGRAQRAEYWYFVLFNLIIGFVLGAVDGMLGGFNAHTGLGALSGLYALAVLIPAIAVAVRRLHDTGRSGWFLLLVFLPIIGGLILLVFMVLDTTSGDNEYGANPKVVTQ